jgi:hypothetical protein
VQVATLINTGAAMVSGPITLGLGQLPRNVRLLGALIVETPDGPAVALNRGLAPGARLRVVLRFRSPRVRFEERPRLVNLPVPGLSYQGGPVLANVGVEVIYYGQQWATDAALKSQEQQLDAYFAALTGGPFMDLLAQYGTPTQAIGRGKFLGSTVVPVPLGTSVDDVTLRQVVRGADQAADANRLTFVFVEPGVAVTNAPLGDSALDFLGYHDAFPGPGNLAVPYAVIPYPTPPNRTRGNGLSPFQSLTAVSSHELAEAVTDPYIHTQPAWHNLSSGQEVADYADDVPVVFLNGDAVTALWSNQAGGVVPPAGATAAPAGGGLSATGQDVTAPAGVPFGQVVALVSTTDQAAAGHLTATIDWGDGSAPDTVLLSGVDATGSFEVLGRHTYRKPGPATIRVTVSDVNTGATAQASSEATVSG